MAGYRKLGRTSSQRKALIRGQVTSLLNNGKIVTTEARAKEISKVAEGLIALAVKEKDNFDEVEVTAKVARKDKDGKRVKETVDGKKVFGLYSKPVELKQTITKEMLEEGITQYLKETHPNYKFYDTNLDGEPLTPENGSWGSEWPEPICRYENFDIVMSR